MAKSKNSAKNDTIIGGFIQRDTPPVSEGPIHFAANMTDTDGTVLTEAKGNWIGPISRLDPSLRKYAKQPAAKKKATAKSKKK